MHFTFPCVMVKGSKCLSLQKDHMLCHDEMASGFVTEKGTQAMSRQKGLHSYHSIMIMYSVMPKGNAF